MKEGDVDPRGADVHGTRDPVGVTPGCDVNVVNFFRRRFHAPVALLYIGLGIVVGNRLRDWFPDASPWVGPLGLLLLLSGAAGIIMATRGKGKPPPGA